MRSVLLALPFAPLWLVACHHPAVTPAPAADAGQPGAATQSAGLPEPGVYILRRIKGNEVATDLKPSEHKVTHGSNFFERVIAGRLYLRPDREYQTIVCADMVDSAGRVLPDPSDRGNGGGNKYWTAGGQVYFSNPIADGGVDSTAVRVRPDTVEFAGQLFTRDRSSVLPPYPLIAGDICRSIRASLVARQPSG